MVVGAILNLRPSGYEPDEALKRPWHESKNKHNRETLLKSSRGWRFEKGTPNWCGGILLQDQYENHVTFTGVLFFDTLYRSIFLNKGLR